MYLLSNDNDMNQFDNFKISLRIVFLGLKLIFRVIIHFGKDIRVVKCSITILVHSVNDSMELGRYQVKY